MYLDAGNTKSYPGSGTTWYDLSGKNNHGTMINGLTYSSEKNGAMLFDGNDDRVDINTLGVYSQYTIMYFNKRYTTGGRMPFGATGNAFYNYGDSSWRYIHGGVSGELYYSKSVSIPDNTWNLWCVTYDGAAVKIYRQSVYEDQKATTGTADFSAGVKLGYYSGGSQYTFSGLMSNILMYDRALSQVEIKQNYNALRGRYGI